MIWKNISYVIICVLLMIAILLSGCATDKMKENIKSEQGNETSVKIALSSIEIPVTGERRSKIQNLIQNGKNLTVSETPIADADEVGIPTDLPALETDTPLPEVTPTTESVSATDSAVTEPTGAISWSVESVIPVAPQDLNQMGVSSTEVQLVNQFKNQISDTSVQVQILPQTNAAAGLGGTAFSVLVKGDGGIDQFKNTIYKDLSSKIHLYNGVTTLAINGNTTAGENMPIRLESNPSTGHIWEVANLDPLYVQVQQDSKFERKGNKYGAPMVQVVSLKSVGNGTTSMQFTYHRPWEKNTPVSNKVNLQVGSGLANIDLSVPVSGGISRPASSPLPNPEPAPLAAAGTVTLPTSFNWGTQGKLTPIRDQGYCGSCWAFSTVGAMESAIKIKTGVTTDLSEQYLVRCNNDDWSCEYGGDFAHNYHTNKFIAPQTVAGAVLESAFPYTATDGTCPKAFSHPYKLTSWYYVGGNDGWTVPSVDAIKQAIYSYGPVSVGVCAGSRFDNYSTGVFATEEAASACGGYTNHAVVLTGWDNATRSWVLRNSWGTYWGENGYMRIRWGISRVGEGANYVVYITPPPAPVLIAPSGSITNTNRPKYQWKTVAGATQYYLVITNATKTLFAQYIPTTNCVSGVCSYTPAVSLVNGNYRFNVRTKKGTLLGNYNPTWKTFTIAR